MKKTKIDLMREELNKLHQKRKEIQLEKGLAAEHNKDLRENGDYIYWEEQELYITIRIQRLSAEIEDLYKKNKKVS